MAESDGGKKRLPIKTIAIVAALLVAEAAVVVGIIMMWGQPSDVRAQGLASEDRAAGEQMTEVLIVNDKFPNHHTGRVFLWEAEVQIKVRQKHLEFVKRVVEERAAEIKTNVAKIFRSAHHNHLKEPQLETLTRRLEEMLRDVFGQDAEGEERVVEVLIPKCVGFPADF
jgi:flagellar basal body-associated protein FliL